MCLCVQSLVTLEQGGSISLSSLEAQLETLLESVVTFNPPGEFSSLSSSTTLSVINPFMTWIVLPFSSAETGLEQRHMAFCGLFSDALALLNGVGVSTGEALAAHVITWLDRKGRGFPILPLLTACSRCLASVRHMTRIMEACITAYFNHGNQSNSLRIFWLPFYLTTFFRKVVSLYGLHLIVTVRLKCLSVLLWCISLTCAYALSHMLIYCTWTIMLFPQKLV